MLLLLFFISVDIAIKYSIFGRGSTNSGAYYARLSPRNLMVLWSFLDFYELLYPLTADLFISYLFLHTFLILFYFFFLRLIIGQSVFNIKTSYFVLGAFCVLVITSWSHIKVLFLHALHPSNSLGESLRSKLESSSNRKKEV